MIWKMLSLFDNVSTPRRRVPPCGLTAGPLLPLDNWAEALVGGAEAFFIELFCRELPKILPKWLVFEELCKDIYNLKI